MKKLLALILALLMVFAFVGCGEKAEPVEDEPVEEAPEAEAKTVSPLPSGIEGESDITVPVTFNAETLAEADGVYTIEAELFSVELFDAVDITTLAAGDTLVIGGEEIVVETTEEKNGFLVINGGIEEGGVELISNEGGTFRASGLDDYPTYASEGVRTLTFAEGLVFTDTSDLENPDGVIADGAALAEAIQNGVLFTHLNTTARIVDDEIQEVSLIYIP